MEKCLLYLLCRGKSREKDKKSGSANSHDGEKEEEGGE